MAKSLPNILNEGLRNDKEFRCKDEPNCIFTKDASEEVNARRKADEYLDKTMPQKFKKVGISRKAVYLWGTEEVGKMSYNNNSNKKGSKKCLLEVDPTKIPCKCATGDNWKADHVFAIYYSRNAGIKEGLNGENDLESAAENFWKSAEIFYPNKKPRIGINEIFCPCDIPPKAIKEVHGCKRI